MQKGSWSVYSLETDQCMYMNIKQKTNQISVMIDQWLFIINGKREKSVYSCLFFYE